MSHKLPPTKCPECEEIMALQLDGFYCPKCNYHLKMKKNEVKAVANFEVSSLAIDAYAEMLQDVVTQIKNKKKLNPRK